MSQGQIAQIRWFNRMITQRVGALEQSYLGRDRPLAEARMLYEIGAEGVEVRGLRERLGLDSGYASRLLRSLEAQGLIELAANADDRRVRQARLTPAGRVELAAYDTLSDDLAQSLLSRLSPDQGDRLVEAMGQVERWIRAASVEIAAEPPDSPEARACLASYFAEIARRFDGGFDPGTGDAAGDRAMAAPSGIFLLARLEGRPVGCGGVKTPPGEPALVKRMWTAPDARGLGIARRILDGLERSARAAGATSIRLDTNRALVEAHALYRAAGYAEIARFSDEPYAHHWFEKAL